MFDMTEPVRIEGPAEGTGPRSGAGMALSVACSGDRCCDSLVCVLSVRCLPSTIGGDMCKGTFVNDGDCMDKGESITIGWSRDGDRLRDVCFGDILIAVLYDVVEGDEGESIMDLELMAVVCAEGVIFDEDCPLAICALEPLLPLGCAVRKFSIGVAACCIEGGRASEVVSI